MGRSLFQRPCVRLGDFFNRLGEIQCQSHLQRRVICYEGCIVGMLTAYWEDGELQQWLEFGIIIYEAKLWNKGIGSFAVKAWITELFAMYPHIQRVGYTTWSGNHGMQKLGEKIGMTKEAQLRSVRYWQGEYYDSVKYGVLRKEWL